MNHLNQSPACRCGHHKIFPVLVVLIGLAFLLEALGVLSTSFVSIAWPILLILLGLSKWTGGGCKCYMNAPQA